MLMLHPTLRERDLRDSAAALRKVMSVAASGVSK
jgi:hypothetical protein